MGALSPDRILPGCPERLPFTDMVQDHAGLLEQATTALARRRNDYPAFVESGELPQDQATADIAAWEWIEAEWRWICTGEGEAPPAWTLFDRIAAIDLALDRISGARSKQPRNSDLAWQEGRLLAMRWHLSRLQGWTPNIHIIAGLTHALRARAALPLCPACERRSSDPATIACTRTDCGLKQKEAA